MENKFLYFKATSVASTIYVKCIEEAMGIVFDAMNDAAHVLTACTEEDWRGGIENDVSYYVNTVEEAEEFVNNNHKYKKLLNNEKK